MSMFVKDIFIQGVTDEVLKSWLA